MPVIAAPVATWVAGAATALGATAATAATIGAVAGSVAVGIVSGAVVGAASAAISGGDIFEGALKGAAVGGIGSGVLSAAGIATGISPAKSQLAKFGLKQGSEGLLAAQTPELTESVVAGASDEVLKKAPSELGATVAKEGSKGILTPETSKILAGVGQGMAQAYGEQKAAEEKAKSERELEEFKQAKISERIAANVPGDFQAKTAIIKLPEHWKRYQTSTQVNIVPQTQSQTGILANEGVA